MIQFKILSGKMAGAVWAARRFPVRIGRGQAADLKLDDDGVWEEHLLVRFVPTTGLVLTAQGEALAAVNGESVREAVLRNGDSISVGSAKLQFWLEDTRQKELGFREVLSWALIGTVLFGQIALLYWLLR